MALIHSDLSEKIIGAAMRVHSALKPGLDEKIYENALVLELSSMGLQIQQQKSFEVIYRQEIVGTLIPDLIVADKVIVDTKVVSTFNDAHVAQMMGYLAITDLALALLINFKNTRLEWKRVVK
jgi:GxxExxY protein